ncbi:YiiD C-terminal domain-containing protein [Legionella sp. CNM-4043-24]|uniref:YiiD C-terminal domain-containing protein n=1 Tax=Legionella sp. CNM-4043-24 TaxID=3421646 RepID=UPI00403B0E6F
MKLSTLLKLMRFWPPFLGAGISVREFSPDYSRLLVQMKIRFWNRNYVGTHFGGSLYAMTDPFYMLMLMKQLGTGYVVWDKSAAIRYRKPATGTVYAQFELQPELIEAIRQQLLTTSKAEPEFKIIVTDTDNNVIAEISKILHISKKT